MFLGCHFVYDLAEAEIVVRDMLAYNATYLYGQALKFGATDGTDLGTVTSAGAGTGLLVGMSNEGGINNGGKVLAGTVAAGTSETLKVIVNPNGVYRIQYDDSSLITWTSVTDTSIVFTSAAAGLANAGGGWAWSYNTGKLDWIVSSSVGGGSTTLVTVTGTDTTSSTGMVLYSQGKNVVTLESTGTMIDPSITDIGVAKTNGFNAVVLCNQIVSQTYGVEKLNPANNAYVDGEYSVPGTATKTPTNRMNQAIRYMISQTTSGKKLDKARAFADVHFGPGNVWNQVS
jgi:hypothetical protein